MHIRRDRGFLRHGRRTLAIVALDLAIVVGVGVHLTGGVATGASMGSIADSDPVRLLGLKLGETSCPSAPLAVGKGTTVVCPRWTAVLSAAGVVEVVSVYGPGNAVVDAYEGSLPLGLHWGEEVTAVWDALGRPDRITGVYGTPTLVYMFDRRAYGSLELRFDGADHLMRVNASRVH
jgi:hypothetical protein